MHRILLATLPGAYLVEIFPVMQYLPAFLAPWKREGQRFYQKYDQMFDTFLDGVKEKMVCLAVFWVSKSVQPSLHSALQVSDPTHTSFSASLLADKEKYDLDEKEIAWLGGTML